MRIVFFAITLGLEAKGGEMYIHQLANALTERGNEVLVLQGGAPLPDARYQAIRIPVPFRLHRMYTGPLRPSFASLQERLIRRANQTAHQAFLSAATPILLTFRPQIIVPLLMEAELSVAKLLRRLLGCRLISVGHGSAGNDALALGAVDAFVATSPRQASWARYFERAMVALIPVGVDIGRFTPEGASATLELERPILLQVGSLLRVKRPQLSMNVVRRLSTGSLLFIGEGELAEVLDEQGKRLGSRRYLRISKLPHQDLASYYRAADVLLFPSDTGETAGLVTLEALASGTPVIATNDETRRWMLAESAILIEPTDSEAFEAAVQKAALQKGSTALRAYAERFSWSSIAAQHEALYQKILAS
jgi:glycosyltransferase involved in cell wall biosynthesis